MVALPGATAEITPSSETLATLLSLLDQTTSARASSPLSSVFTLLASVVVTTRQSASLITFLSPSTVVLSVVFMLVALGAFAVAGSTKATFVTADVVITVRLKSSDLPSNFIPSAPTAVAVTLYTPSFVSFLVFTVPFDTVMPAAFAASSTVHCTFVETA